MSIAPNLRTVHDDVLKQAVIGSGAQGITPYSAIGELSRRINEANRMKQMQGQMAQQQNQPQPPIAQQVVAEADMDRGIGGLPVGGEYAAGGVVAFNAGNRVEGEEPSPYDIERAKFDKEGGDILKGNLTGLYDRIPENSGLKRLANFLSNREEAMNVREGRVPPPGKETSIGQSPPQFVDLAKQGYKLVPGVGLVDRDGKVIRGVPKSEAAPKAPALAAAARPRPVAPPPPPVVPPAPVAQPAGPVAPPQADLEAQLQTDVKAQQALMEKQKGVAPEVLAARKRAEDMAQASVTRREADRAKMEDEMKARSGRDWTQNTELIGSMLGGLRGAKTLGDALAGAGAAAGVTTTAQRKEQMEQQALMRIEANAIDTLKQAQADKQVAIATGDTDKAQAADKAIAEASTALTQARQKMRSEIAKTKAEQESAAASTASAQAATKRAATEERETPLDRASRERIAASGLAAAQIQRDAMMDLSKEKFAEQQYKNSAEYKNIQKEIDAAETRHRLAPDAASKLRLEKAKAKEVALRAKFTGTSAGAPPPPPAPLTPEQATALAKYGITK